MEQLTAKLVETNLDSVATEENTVIVTAKAGLAAAISAKGVATDKTDSFQQMIENIYMIPQVGPGPTPPVQTFISDVRKLWGYQKGSFTEDFTVAEEGLYVFGCFGNNNQSYGGLGWPNTFGITGGEPIYEIDTGISGDSGYLKVLYLPVGVTVRVHNSYNYHWTGSINFGFYIGSGAFDAMSKIDYQAVSDSPQTYYCINSDDLNLYIAIAKGASNSYVTDNTILSIADEATKYNENWPNTAGIYVGCGKGIQGNLVMRGYDGGNSMIIKIKIT